MISLFKNITFLISIIIWSRNWTLNDRWVWIPTVIITRIENNVQLSSVNWVPELPRRYVARSHRLGGGVRNAVDLDSAESWLDRPRHTVALVTSYQVTLKTSPLGWGTSSGGKRPYLMSSLMATSSNLWRRDAMLTTDNQTTPTIIEQIRK